MYIFSPLFEKELSSLIEKNFEEILKRVAPQTNNHKKIDTGEYLTKKQVCKFLNISSSNLNNHLKKGKIKKYRIGSRVLIKKSELENGLIISK